jgi:hypothetical protein
MLPLFMTSQAGVGHHFAHYGKESYYLSIADCEWRIAELKI